MTAPADEPNVNEPDVNDLEDLEDIEGLDDEDSTEEIAAKKQASRKKLLKFVLIGLAVFVLIAGPTAYFMGWLHAMLGIEQEKHLALIELGKPVNHPLPQIKTDLKVGTCKSPFLRTQFDVQLSSENIVRLQEAEARIMEQIILHLRDQERIDLVGKAGSDKLRFDLVQIINNAITPARIHGITFKEFVLQ